MSKGGGERIDWSRGYPFVIGVNAPRPTEPVQPARQPAPAEAPRPAGPAGGHDLRGGHAGSSGTKAPPG